MSWGGNNRGGRGGKSRSGDHDSSSSRHQRDAPRNIITGEGMDCEDSYTTGGNIHQSNTWHGDQRSPGNQQPIEPVGGNFPGMRPQMTGHSGHGRQAQTQEHIFRSAQASKQMVYEVYGNCITMLEELESRELKHMGIKPLPRSDIHLPDQKKHDNDTIQRKLETQLLLFQSQLEGCDKTIKDEVKHELKENTLCWISQRQKKEIPHGVTDNYAGKLFEVIERGKTEHPRDFYQPPSMDETGMQNAMQAIVTGNHKREQLDEDFRKHPDKQAARPNLRSGAGIDKGAERIADVRPDMHNAVDSYRTQSLR